MSKYSELSHDEFLAKIKAIRIDADEKLADVRATLEPMLNELRHFDRKTNNAFRF